FEVSVFVNDKAISSGSGKSKKQAEQAAAKEALERLSED
ncbi:putative dsRNA-binding protein, partial [Streptococcus suis]